MQAFNADVPQPLPLPPDPNHSALKNHCYNCLVLGHNQNKCRQTERVCALCWQKGHQAKQCQGMSMHKRKRYDPMQPRGNIGDHMMPQNISTTLNAFISETPSLRSNHDELQKGIMIDERLKGNHTANKLQAVLMAICKVDIPFCISQLF
jgi:hypothetical protein